MYRINPLFPLRKSFWLVRLILSIFLVSCSISTEENPINPVINSKTEAPVVKETPKLQGSVPQIENSTLPPLEPSPPLTPIAEETQNEPVSILVDPELLKPNYFLSADLAYQAHSLKVREVISLTNTLDDVLPDLVFGVDALNWEKGFTLNKFSITNNYSVSVTLTKGLMQVLVQPSIQPGEFLTVTIDFQLDLVLGGGSTGYTNRQANFGDWYPYLVLYKPGIGWVYHPPAVVGEAQILPVANFDVKLTLDNSDLILATSLYFEQENGNYHWAGKNIRNVTWSVSPEYIVLENHSKDHLIRQFVFPEHQMAGEASLEVAQKAFKLFTEMFGSNNRNYLSIVEVEFFDGMEYDGLFFLSQDYFAAYSGNPMGYLTIITAHEVAHQWWYANIANDQANEPWLDEALCTYSEKLFFQHYFPYLLDWWQVFRIDRYAPTGWVNSSIYDFVGFRPYVDAVYLRGALYLEAIDQEIGEEAVLSLLQRYNHDYSGRIATSPDFEEYLIDYLTKERIEEIKSGFFIPIP